MPTFRDEALNQRIKNSAQGKTCATCGRRVDAAGDALERMGGKTGQAVKDLRKINRQRQKLLEDL